MKKSPHLNYAGVLVTLCFLAFLPFCGGPDLSRFAYLKNPQIAKKSAQRVLVMEVTGDPGVSGKTGFSTLYKVLYKLDDARPGNEVGAPRARWPKPFSTPREQWVGIFAVPVKATVATLPPAVQKDYPKVRLETWEYGMMGEILHVGPYATEVPTVERLHRYIQEQGYEIAGLENHEEEYLKGPGMFFAGNPDTYQTIIRYPVGRRRP